MYPLLIKLCHKHTVRKCIYIEKSQTHFTSVIFLTIMVNFNFIKPGVLPVAIGASFAVAATAPQFLSNPKEVVAIADFPYGFDKLVDGNIVFTAKDGGPVNVHVDLTGLPSDDSITYHVHEGGVPSDGDCEAIGPILDPFAGQEDCGTDPAQCKIGDLSGKHGDVCGDIFEQKYVDSFLSLDTNAPASILGKSIALHLSNGTKFACANIEAAAKVRLASLKEEYLGSGNDDLAFLEEIDGPLETLTPVVEEPLTDFAAMTSFLWEHANATQFHNFSAAAEWNCTHDDEDTQTVKTSICEDSAATISASLMSLLSLLAFL